MSLSLNMYLNASVNITNCKTEMKRYIMYLSYTTVITNFSLV